VRSEDKGRKAKTKVHQLGRHYITKYVIMLMGMSLEEIEVKCISQF
jgi:hypothetical protein